jgi:hypothetical protein
MSDEDRMEDCVPVVSWRHRVRFNVPTHSSFSSIDTKFSILKGQTESGFIISEQNSLMPRDIGRYLETKPGPETTAQHQRNKFSYMNSSPIKSNAKTRTFNPFTSDKSYLISTIDLMIVGTIAMDMLEMLKSITKLSP